MRYAHKIILAITLLFFTTFFTACTPVTEEHEKGRTSHQQNDSNDTTITIASFNIQVFGKTKAGKPQVMQILAKTITRFDIVAIQEIRDASGTAIKKLEATVDALGTNYDYIIGPRLGRTSSKEQYAYMYRLTTVTPSQSYSYNDTAQDTFHREPYIAKFTAKKGNFDFVLITIHTDPDEATQEINALPLAIKDAQDHFPDEQDFIILGDLNADCNYFDETDRTCPVRSPEYVWLITNNMDTNLAKSSCTYDRIITTIQAKEDYAGQSGVFRFDSDFGLDPTEAKKVSDHYPVWSAFYVNRDTD